LCSTQNILSTPRLMSAIVVGSSIPLRPCFLGRWRCRPQPLVCRVSLQWAGNPDHRSATAKYTLRRKSKNTSPALCRQASSCCDVVAVCAQADRHKLLWPTGNSTRERCACFAQGLLRRFDGSCRAVGCLGSLVIARIKGKHVRYNALFR